MKLVEKSSDMTFYERLLLLNILKKPSRPETNKVVSVEQLNLFSDIKNAIFNYFFSESKLYISDRVEDNLKSNLILLKDAINRMKPLDE